jgi:hypothetical protein
LLKAVTLSAVTLVTEATAAMLAVLHLSPSSARTKLKAVTEATLVEAVTLKKLVTLK